MFSLLMSLESIYDVSIKFNGNKLYHMEYIKYLSMYIYEYLNFNFNIQ